MQPLVSACSRIRACTSMPLEELQWSRLHIPHDRFSIGITRRSARQTPIAQSDWKHVFRNLWAHAIKSTRRAAAADSTVPPPPQAKGAFHVSRRLPGSLEERTCVQRPKSPR